MPRILVLGATGTVGRPLLTELIAQDATVRGATRDPLRAAAINPNPEWTEFDFQRPATFAPALADVERVFLISRPGDDAADRFAVPFIDALRTAGVQHVVNLSAMGAEQQPEFSIRRVELLLEASGIPFTHLRPNFFMQIHAAGALCQSIRQARRLALPAADALLSFIDARDVAAVAAHVLHDPSAHAGHAYTLTGPQALDYHQVAAHVSAAAGQRVGYVPIDDDAMRTMLQSAHLPERQIVRLLGMYRLVRAGACAPVSHNVEALLGRPAIRFEAFATDYANCWR